MPEVAALHPLAAAVVALGVLGAGAWLTAALGRALAPAPLRAGARDALVGPLATAALWARQRPADTERPDALLRALAPAAYAALAAAALAVVPLGEGVAIADVRTGIVLFGAAEALAIVAVFLHGWAPNSHLPLVGGYRFVGVALSYELVSMFVLIAAALPAESLQVSTIVRSQADLWNVVRQPLGLPLWLVVMLGVTFRGPLAVADARDLAGGTAAEAAGLPRLLWEAGRGGMLAVLAGMGAAVFLGGWHGPLLPGWAWMALKTVALLALAVALGERTARVPAERAVTVLWTVLLPASFLHLVLAGWEALP